MEIRTAADVIDAFGGATSFAAIIGRKPSTASEMKRNGSIPARYWLKVVEAAGEKGLADITLERLAEIAASPPTAPDAPSDQPASPETEKAGS